MSKTWNKRYIDLKVEELTKQNVYIVGQGNVDRTNKGKADGKITIYPYTIINLLGKYGDFETDSNGDGVADGWSLPYSSAYNSGSIVSGLKGNSQRVTTTLDGSGGFHYAQINFFSLNLQSGDVIFFTSCMKRDLVSDLVRIVLAGTTSHEFTLTGDPTSTNNWSMFYKTITLTEAKNALGIYNRYDNSQTATVNTDYDMFALYNLTAMGALPYGLQQYFALAGVQLWEDLATNSNIEALDGRVQTGEDWLAELLPYVNGIASLGFAWEGI